MHERWLGLCVQQIMMNEPIPRTVATTLHAHFLTSHWHTTIKNFCTSFHLTSNHFQVSTWCSVALFYSDVIIIFFHSSPHAPHHELVQTQFNFSTHIHIHTVRCKQTNIITFTFVLPFAAQYAPLQFTFHIQMNECYLWFSFHWNKLWCVLVLCWKYK